MGWRSLVLSLAVCASCGALVGCRGEDVYTLYRNSPAFPDMRIHVATFDATGGDRYNNENCQIARTLFEGQPGVVVRYWCEKGRYQK